MIKAILVGVSEYAFSCSSLPKCLYDIYAMREALAVGLNAKFENIVLCGDHAIVNMADFQKELYSMLDQINESDTFIFYFSGHGCKKDDINYLVFSDNKVEVKEMIKMIDNINCNNKIIILDSCYSGNENTGLETAIDINKTVDEFVGHGCAVMASCSLEETSGFDSKVPLSLYTRILFDAFTARTLIRKGKKSLDIRTYVDRLVEIANKNKKSVQHNAFRTNIVGTIYFDVEDYEPYKPQDFYKETEKYIIYSVDPVHTAHVKRISLSVILRFPCSETELADIANEIKDEALKYEVYRDENSERRFRGKLNNIIFSYYGYDESDILNSTFAYRTVWIDKEQDKNNWYNIKNHSCVMNDIWIEIIDSYDYMKKFILDNTVDDNILVVEMRNCMYKMIDCAEKFIREYREYINGTRTEQELIHNVDGITSEIRNLYLEQSDFPIASNKLHDWQVAFTNLAATIDDFKLCYDEYSLNRNSREGLQKIENIIKRYDNDLKKVKEIDTFLKEKLRS